jgi:hypothetical protein
MVAQRPGWLYSPYGIRQRNQSLRESLQCPTQCQHFDPAQLTAYLESVKFWGVLIDP